jgi:hypothetical protein
MYCNLKKREDGKEMEMAAGRATNKDSKRVQKKMGRR